MGARVAVVILGALVGACSNSSGTPTTPTVPQPSPAAAAITSVRVTGPARISLGSAPVPLVVNATYNDGSQQDVTRSATWASAANDVATVSAAGVIEPRGEGVATITATVQAVTGSLAIVVGPRLVDVRGTVREAYGGQPIAQAAVTIVDGAAIGRQAITDASGTFVFTALESTTFTVTATATDFEVDTARIVNGTAAPIRLEPLATERLWHGLYSPLMTLNERGSLVVNHAGPIVGTLHTDCSVGDSELGPLGLIVWNGPVDARGLPLPGSERVIAESVAASDRDIRQTAIVQPGTYYFFAKMQEPFGGNPPATCGWRITLSVPR